MLKLKLALVLLASGLGLAKAEVASTNAKAFCADRKSDAYVKELLANEDNNLAFYNQGGLVNGGVCWWHSRFTRNAALLAIYRPDLSAPTSEQAKKIIKDIRMGKVTEVPGFNNLREFSDAFYPEVLERLEKWQIGDGFLRQQWLVGLWGSSKTSAKKMKKRMDDLYDYVVKENKTAYQMIQIRGITAHAWLVLDMKKLENGYEMTVLDSNYRGTYVVNYEYGQTNIGRYGGSVPITGKKSELKKLEKAVDKYCKNLN